MIFVESCGGRVWRESDWPVVRGPEFEFFK